MSWFRYYCEAPEESGGGGEVAEAVEEEAPARVSAFEKPDLWDAPPGEEPPADEGEGPPAGAPGAAPLAEDTLVAAVQPEGWADEDWAAFQKKYPGGSAGDLWKHYSALQSEFSRVKNGVGTPEPEPEAAPPGFTHPDYSILGEIPVDGLTAPERAAVEGLMAEDPKAAAYWSLKNSHKLTEPEFDAIQNNWAASDPQGYRRFWEENAQRLERERQEEEFGPRMEVVDIQRQREGIAQAEAAVPEITAHRDAFKEWLASRPEIDEHLATITEPEAVKNAVMTAFYQFYGPYRMQMDATQAAEAEAAEAKAAEEAEQAAAEAERQNKRARTATRTAPSAPDGNVASEDDIKAAIRGAAR